MFKVLLTVFTLSVLFVSVSASLNGLQARGGEDRKGTFNKYEEPYQYWFTMPNP